MKKTLLALAVLFSLTSAWAGSNHFHPKQIVKCGGECSVEQIKSAVPNAIPYLQKWKKIDAAWSSATIGDVQKKQFKKGPEWVVTLLDSAQQKRYVFFTLDGFVTGSNSTGE